MKIQNYHATRLQSSHEDLVETAKCVELELLRDFPMATRFKSRHPESGLLLRVIESEGVAWRSCNAACVVLQHIFQMALILGIAHSLRIRIRHERVKGKWRAGVAVRCVKIHVLRESVGIEEIVARPAVRQFRQMRGGEINHPFIA